MNYEDLKIMMSSYRLGFLSETEIQAAFHLWQRDEGEAMLKRGLSFPMSETVNSYHDLFYTGSLQYFRRMTVHIKAVA